MAGAAGTADLMVTQSPARTRPTMSGRRRRKSSSLIRRTRPLPSRAGVVQVDGRCRRSRLPTRPGPNRPFGPVPGGRGAGGTGRRGDLWDRGGTAAWARFPIGGRVEVPAPTRSGGGVEAGGRATSDAGAGEG